MLSKSLLIFDNSLAAVNFFLGVVGATQVTRILLYQQSLKKGTVSEVVEADSKEVGRTVKDTAKAAVQ